jgi:hypothetical protein
MRRRALVYMRLAEAGENRMSLAKTLALLDKVRVDAEALGDNALLARMYLADGLERILRGEQIRSSEPLRTALEKSEEYAERTGNAELAAMPRRSWVRRFITTRSTARPSGCSRTRSRSWRLSGDLIEHHTLRTHSRCRMAASAISIGRTTGY